MVYEKKMLNSIEIIENMSVGKLRREHTKKKGNLKRSYWKYNRTLAIKTFQSFIFQSLWYVLNFNFAEFK